MRVVYFSFENRGGMRHYVDSLHDAYSLIGESSIARIIDNSESVTEQMSEEVIARRNTGGGILRKLAQKYNPLFYAKAANALLTKFQPNVVHITSTSLGLGIFVRTLKKQEVKVVFTVHDPMPHEERTTIWGRIVAAYQKRIQMPAVISALDAIHVHSPKHLENLQALYGDAVIGKAYVVQHGGGIPKAVAAGSVVPEELAEIDHVNIPWALFFGRIETYKGVDILADAMRKLQQKHIQCGVIVAGAGDQVAHLFCDLNDRVVINRFIRDEEVGSIFKACDLVVLPYRSATQTGVVPLAYAFERPVVVTRVGALDEIVCGGITGYVVESPDADSLTLVLEKAIKDRSQLKEMGVAGRAYLLAELSWENTVRAHAKVYSQLVSD